MLTGPCPYAALAEGIDLDVPQPAVAGYPASGSWHAIWGCDEGQDYGAGRR